MKETLWFASAPGRTEICGNHTDHNRGNVLAGAVNLDTLAAVSPCAEPVVTVHSEGHAPITVDLRELAPVEAEKGSSRSLVRGIAYWLKDHGYSRGRFSGRDHHRRFLRQRVKLIRGV